ncbi:MAG: hypothetical protein ACK4FV_01420 [Candidatus Nitrosocaldus sp.]
MGDIVKDIIEVLLRKGEVRLVELIAMLNASEERVRSAVNTLESVGLVDVEKGNLSIRLSDEARRLLER